MLTYRQYGDFIMSEEQKIFLPGTESATIVSQAMVMATRMELLDLLDYARKNKLDSISVEYLQGQITDLWKIDEKVYNAHEEDYLKAHSNSRWISVKERLPKEDQLVLVSHYGMSYNVDTIAANKIGDYDTDENGFRTYPCQFDGNVYGVDYWMPIPITPNGEQEMQVPGDNEQPKAGLETERERIFYLLGQCEGGIEALKWKSVDKELPKKGENVIVGFVYDDGNGGKNQGVCISKRLTDERLEKMVSLANDPSKGYQAKPSDFVDENGFEHRRNVTEQNYKVEYWKRLPQFPKGGEVW